MEVFRDCQPLTYSKTGYSRGATMPDHHHVFYGAQFLWTTYSEIAPHALRFFRSIFLDEKTDIRSCDFVTRQLFFGKKKKKPLAYLVNYIEMTII